MEASGPQPDAGDSVTLAAWLIGTAAYCLARPLGMAFAVAFALLTAAALPVVSA